MRFLRPLAFTVALALPAHLPTFGQDKEKPKKDLAKPAPTGLQELLKGSADDFIKRFDKNGDGMLSKDELPPQLQEGFERLDRNNDGKLDKQEVEVMLKFLRKRYAQPEPPKPPQPNTAEVEQFVQRIFERLDTNKDGKISKEEALGPIAQNFAEIDTNKDGFVDRDELRKFAARFLSTTTPPRPARPPVPVVNIPDFDAYDRNADGRLTPEELKGTPYADKFAEMDTNKDGKVDRKEFEAYFKREALKKEAAKKDEKPK